MADSGVVSTLLNHTIIMLSFAIFTRKIRSKTAEKEFQEVVKAPDKRTAINNYCRNHNSLWVSAKKCKK